MIALHWNAQVKVWFQNRRTKYKRAKTDDEQDESSAQSPDSENLRERTTHVVNDDDNDAGKNATVTGDKDSVDCSNVTPPTSEQTRTSPTTVCQHNGNDRVPPAGCHGDDFRSLLLTSRHTVSGCQDSGRKHNSHNTSTTSRRYKTSHHVNRWRAETNQL